MNIAVEASDVDRMRDQLFFDGPARGHKLSRFWLLLLLAAVIASAGVIGDSTATVIGAMIVAPLMTPILGVPLAAVLADRANLVRSVVLVVGGACAVIAVGFALGVLTSVPVVAATNSQVAQRVSPDLVDLLAALATGAVGAVALCRSDISDTLPGVAIAISLVPPLAVVGLTLESGAPEQSAGALLLFVTNVSAIFAMGLVVMAIYRVTAHAAGDVGRTRVRVAEVTVVMVLLVAVPLAITSVRASRAEHDEASVRAVSDVWAARHGWEVAQVSTDAIGYSVRVTGPPPEPPTDDLRADLDQAGLQGVAVEVDLIPSTTRHL